MADPTTQTRTLDHGSQPERFARGWHCLGLASQFKDGKPHAVEAFGGKLVVWENTKASWECSTATAATWAATSPRAP